MLTIPVKFDVNTGDVKAALDELERGSKEAFEQILAFDKTKISVEYRLDVNGKEVREELTAVERKIRDLEKSRKRATGGEEGSIGRTKQLVRQLERQRQETKKNSKEWYNLSTALSSAKAELRALNGVQEGSIARTKELRADALKLRDSVKIGSDQFNILTEKIKSYDEVLGSTTEKQKGFFSKLRSAAGTIAVASAAFLGVSAAIRTVNNTIDVFTRRQKEIEGFSLALENIGLSQSEVNTVFKQARVTAGELGAPLQQIEKSYKRILPALQAVGTSAQDSDKFIEAITARTQTLGLNTEQSGRLLEAFAQVLSKGKLQAEELNQQISELDGAFRTQLADALGVTSAELNELVKNSKVTADVFVKAVLEMENGVELLKRRVREGSATIQQFQNLIRNLDTANIELIGKQIEPAIKGFLQIQQAFLEFVNTIARSQFGRFLSDTFNNLVLAIRDFIKGATEAAKAVGFFLEPVFALLRIFSLFLRIIVPVGLAFVTLKGLTLAYAKIAEYTTTRVVPLTKALVVKAVAAGKASTAVGALSVAQGKLAATTKTLLLRLGPALAVLGLLSLAIGEFQSGSESGREAVAGLEDGIKELERALEENGDQVQRNIDLFKELKKLVPGFGLLEGLGQSKEVNEKVLIPLEKSLNRVLDAGKVFKKEFPALIGAGDDDIKKRRKDVKKFIEEGDAFLAKENELREAANKKGNFVLSQSIREVGDEIYNNLPVLRKQLALLDEEIEKRKGLREEIEYSIKSLEELNEAHKKRKEVFDLAELTAEVALLREYGDTVEDVAKRELLLAGVQENRAKVNLAMMKKELDQARKAKAEEFGGPEKKASVIQELTKRILEEEKKAIEAAKRIADVVQQEIERVFAESTEAAANYAEIAKDVAGAIDDVRGSMSSALSVAKQAANLVFDRAKEGAGFSQQQEIERARFRTLARIQNIENIIAQAKLRTAFQIQEIEAKTLQAKLRGEAALARSFGKNAAADNLERSANSLDEVIKLNRQSFEIEKASLDLQKKMNDEILLEKALNTKIMDQNGRLFSNHSNRIIAARETAKALGLQRLSYEDIERIVRKIEQSSSGLGASDEKSITAANNSLKIQEGALQDSVNKGKELQKSYKQNTQQVKLLGDALEWVKDNTTILGNEQEYYNTELEKSLRIVKLLKQELSGGTSARWMGGPVQGGQTYRVNDAGLGREAFMNRFGNVSMLPAGSNINWTAPSSGTIIPAKVVKQMQLDGKANSVIDNVRGKDRPSISLTASSMGRENSGNLVKQMTAAMSASGGNQRITNNVTIQSQQPVTDASQIMTNVARMRLRNGRRI